MNNKLLTIPEYKKRKLDNHLSEDFINYIQNEKFNPKCKNSDYSNIIVKDNVQIHNNGPWFGVIKNINNSKEGLVFVPKFIEKNELDEKSLSFFLHILSYYEDESSFLIDDENFIEVENGQIFFDVIAKIFLTELKRIIKIGILKKYVEKEENLKFLKGKLLLNQNLKFNSFNKSKVYCKYEDLTFDNIENKIILYSLKLLSQKIKNTDLRFQILKYYNILYEEISLEKINISIFYRLKYNRINLHYKKIHNLSRFIIENSYIKNFEENKGIGFNFLADMNKMYEFYVTHLIKEVVKETYEELYVISQSEAYDLVDEGKEFKIKPDIIIKKKNDVVLVIDVKYKDYLNNPDFYQIVAYTINYEKLNQGLLIYEDFKKCKDDYSRIHKPGIDLTIFFAKLNLFNENILSADIKIMEEYCKKQIRKVLEKEFVNNKRIGCFVK